MPEAFPLSEPTKEEQLTRKGVTGEETLAGRTSRQLVARQTAADAKQAEAATASGSDWANQQLAAQQEQARLEAEHGRIQTIGSQTAQGIMNGLLYVPSLAGAGLESLGTAAGLDTLRDFGRDVGRASTGKNALGSLAAAQSLAFGGTPAEGYQQLERGLDEQTKAWPLLSSISRGAGSIAGVALTGGVGGAGAGASVARTALAAGVEGAGAGAQSGYEQDAPLRDVLTSAVIGGAFAAGTAGAIGGTQKWLASKAAREAFEGAANERAGAAIGLTKAQINKLGTKEAEAIGKDVAEHTLDNGEKVLPDTLIGALTEGKGTIAPRILQGKAEIGAKIGAIRDAASQFIEEKAPELRPSATDLIGTIKSTVLKEAEDNPLLSARVGQINKAISLIEKHANEDGTISVANLRKAQEGLKDFVYPKSSFAHVPEAKIELQSIERLMEDSVTSAVDKVAPKLGSETAAGYTKLKGLYGSFRTAAESIEKAQGGAHGNNYFPLTSQLAGMAEFAESGGGVVGALKGGVAAAVHKYAKNQLPVALQYGARKLAQGAPELAEALAPASVSVAAAGGREAATVINILSRSRAAVADAVEQAGPNPDMRAVAQRDAADEQSRALHEAAGDFHPASVFDQTPTPVQKVVFRGPILDHVSQDIAQGVQAAMARVPDADLQLDPQRIAKSLRDTDSQAVIGRMQARIQDIARQAPPTMQGDQMRSLAAQTRGELATVEAPRSVVLAHDLAEKLRSFAGQAQDEVSRDFALRSADGLHDDLTSEDLGQFGQLYSKAFPSAPDRFAAMADPEALREHLRTAKERGALPTAIKEFSSAIEDAHNARETLSGAEPDRAVLEQLKELQKRSVKAEAAVTLDGGPVGRVLDHFEGPAVPAQDLSTLVTRTVSDHIARLVPHLRNDSDAIDESRPPPKQMLTPEAQQAQYQSRIEQVSQSMADPMGGKLAAGLYGHPSIPPDLATIVGADAQQRMAQLAQDMPKPQQSIRGKAFETLSSDDVRRGNAMWEATMRPMGLFDDFRRGAIDYDRVQYTWKQYPALQQASQLGLLDALHGHLDDKERERMPDSVLTQLDYLLGFGGKLQGSLDPAFSARMTAIYSQQSQQQPSPQSAQLNLPGAKPTFTEKMMGNRG